MASSGRFFRVLFQLDGLKKLDPVNKEDNDPDNDGLILMIRMIGVFMKRRPSLCRSSIPPDRKKKVS
jgi:hypothetical protein